MTDNPDVIALLALHARRHKARQGIRRQAEVKDFLRRHAGLAPDARDMPYTLNELTNEQIRAARRTAEATTTDMIHLNRE